jgi:VWFA-related protein
MTTSPPVRRPHLAALLATAILISSPTAQQPPASPPTFRAGVDLVTFDVSVLDKDRHPVRGLTAADFTVLENGKPQTIIGFRAVDMPDRLAFRAGWMRAVPEDVVSNVVDADRVVMIVLDDWWMSNTAIDSEYLRHIVRDVVDGLGPSDIAAVAYPFLQREGQDLTTDRTLLFAAIDRFRPHGFKGNSGACPRGDCVRDAVRGAAEALSAWPTKRKILVYVGPGFAVGTGGNIEQGAFEENIQGWSDVASHEAMLTALRRNNVSVYEYSVRGVTGSIVSRGGSTSNITGGFDVQNTNTPWDRVPEMFAENDSYYVIGYQTNTPPTDGKPRSVVVRVSRKDARVRARPGYYPPAPPDPKKKAHGIIPPLDKAMAGALPANALPIDLTVAPFGTTRPDKEAALAIVAGISQAPDLPFKDTLNVAARAYSSESAMGKAVWNGVSRATIQLLRAPTATGDVHYDTPIRIDVKPGRYQVRLGIESPATGLTSSVYAPIEVPNFAKDPLALSGVLIALLPETPPKGRDSLGGLVPFLPTTRRSFGAGERAEAFMRVYQGGKKPIVPLQLTTRIQDQDGKQVFEKIQMLDASAFGAPLRATEYRLELPLATLAPGEFLLSIEASAGTRIERRAVRFRREFGSP